MVDDDVPARHRLVVLDVLDEAQEHLLRGAVAVHNDSQRARWGDQGRLHTLETVRATAADEAEEDRDAVVVEPSGDGDEDRVVGWAALTLPLRDNPDLAFLRLSVHPAHLRRGVGSALLRWVEDEATGAGRTTVIASSSAPVDVPDPAEGFGRAHGYVVGQVNHRNRLRLPAPGVPERDAALRRWRELAAAPDRSAAAGAPAYRVDVAFDEPPEAWWEGMARQWQRLSTDAPAGDVPYGEEEWDAARVRSKARRALASGAHLAWGAAFDPAGSMVALTEVETNPADPTSAQQDITLVLREHRGHGLGQRIKAANAAQLLERLPELREVRTWNAVSNAAMLATNQALGYETIGWAREWVTTLSPDPPIGGELSVTRRV